MRASCPGGKPYASAYMSVAIRAWQLVPLRCMRCTAPDRLTMSRFEWLTCCKCEEASESGQREESLKALVQDGEEALEWQIVQRGVGEEEFRALLQLRGHVRDCDSHPACAHHKLSRQPQTLLRFLRARSGDLRKAEAMFRSMLEWRLSFGVDEKVRKWRKELGQQRSHRSIQMKHFETDIDLCPDRHGVPIRLIRTSAADVQGLVREFGKDIVLTNTLLRMELAHEQIRRAMFEREDLVCGQLQIIDMGDYGRHGVPNLTSRLWSSLKLGAEFSQITDSNYPETVRKAFIIRLGSCTSTTWRYFIQPLLPDRTQAKLVPCGPQAASWASLSAELPPDRWERLPAFLREDSEAALAAAEPRGGLVPPGLAGANQGQWELEPCKKRRPSHSRLSLNLDSKPFGNTCARMQVLIFGAVALAAGALAVEPVGLL
ncbi:unnamed protein product [Effrenium voratum]|uniref:CRAL-TRIO domain-containing protein n=1 Tax=Effrenium voratum TaxID=2562239 RepID=A0AA36MRR7_9DINO|nr:unnamed protein product [Effrenium voratum]CAJ1377728.1 unnamed protein product [Effrenium voratum]